METPLISIPLHGPPTSSAREFLARTTRTPDPPPVESDLLKAIRTALRGSDTESISTIQSTSFFYEGEPWEEDELTWNAHTVVLSRGGVMRKKWNFEEEGQAIQWACIGWLEQNIPANPASSHATAHYTSNEPPPRVEPGERPTFGPFAQVQQNTVPDLGKLTRVPSVFVFLRSIGKIYLQDGLEYTFALPFIVRKAWPLSPHGVMIQRVLEPSELEEADLTGDAVLPTIFSVTSPFSEAAAVGLTTGIIGGFGDGTPSLKDEDENSTRPLKPVSPTEMVVWASHRGPASKDDVLVTVDIEKHQLSVWRYVYIKPKDTPLPLGSERAEGMAKKRPSMAGAGSRRSSALFGDMRHPLSPTLHTRTLSQTSDFAGFPELPPLSSLPGMPPALSTTTTMASLVTGGSSQWSAPTKGRRNSLTRNDLSVTMDRMVLGGRFDGDPSLVPMEHGRMKAAYWMERVYSQDLSTYDAQAWRSISVALFDDRWDGTAARSLMSICLPNSKSSLIFSLTPGEDNVLKAVLLSQLPAISVTSLRMTRNNVWDLLVVKPDHRLAILTHGTYEVPIKFERPLEVVAHSNDDMTMQVDTSLSHPSVEHGPVVRVQSGSLSNVTITFQDGWEERTTIDLVPQDSLTSQCLQILALTLPSDVLFPLHHTFLGKWSSRNRSTSNNVEFECLIESLFSFFRLQPQSSPVTPDLWTMLGMTSSHDRFSEDPVLKRLDVPLTPPSAYPRPELHKPHPLLAPVLYALHTLGEDLRLMVHHYQSLVRLVPVICRIAWAIRPEWADYWKRLCPDAIAEWPSPATTVIENVDDRLPVWPPDISAILYGRISNPDWQVPWHDTNDVAIRFGMVPSFAFGRLDPLASLRHLTSVYRCLADSTVPETQKRAENAVYLMVTERLGPEFLNRLPIGIAAPLREASRTCQLAPPGDWPLAAYRAIGRNDLAASANDAPDLLFSDGYKPVKEFINPSRPRRTIGEIVNEARASAGGEVEVVSGVELDLAEFTDIRFGQDRRLEEVARMLCSSKIPSVRGIERPELNEHDQTKEHQNQVLRMAERTLALPFGRAMFTFGSVPTVTREAYTIPKIEYSVRVQPWNITVTPEPGKIPMESINWGDFHNGVAAGLRISPFSGAVESSWIAFNKPSDLTPEHAGFLFGLGLTGHLKEMLTWHTFGYLTPKHDLTSIGVLLGLSAANVGSGNQHVTKLLAVHTPALLPTPNVDLNVSLMTQAAGLAGVGLLYLGTKNRRMAEVCLNQISRRDLVQPDLSNEHREAYTYAAALAFGMIMLGKGSTIPADIALISRLSILIHGEAGVATRKTMHPPFDINLTSPAATIALGLMYLRTERQDIADILTIPDTVLALNRIQPSFLLIRTIARALIMWDAVAPTGDWLVTQIPAAIREAMDSHTKGRPIDDSMELAYYNILAGSCFVVGLKYAGTARQAAYMMIIRYFDMFTRLVYSNGPAFDHKIKRSAYRDGLNLISISLSMVMAGTGEITCFRRLRYAYGMYQQAMYHQPFKYGIHMATHIAIGLLFLGGGRFTLGTSDAAIACMVTAFFPRFHAMSSDNKSYLQALRHLWVLAVEPRCLTARDVDSTEVVYLPVKITMKEGNDIGTTQLISPTLIPDLDKLLSIRVDTPRYWPFYLDTENLPRHRQSLLRSQTLFVKRRTAFLSYTEDPRGSRSLFVRSGSSAGDAATLDFPQSTDTKIHPAGDLSEFITSFSNDILFLAFADHFSRDTENDEERLFQVYCHAALLDSILQDKPQTLQTHLTLFRYRTMSLKSRYFHLRLQDLRFAADFYSKIYDRRFSGRAENNPRPPLIRDSTVAGALHALDQQLDTIRAEPQFITALGQYARGEPITESQAGISTSLAWYLLRNGVPVSTLLIILRGLARDAHAQCLGLPPPEGTSDAVALDLGIKEVLHGAGTKMTTALGSGWSVRSLDEIINAWKLVG
ncbi:putative anaphase promoting complex subunit 1 [Lyophyllum shimeji]|uniref:Anaphase promoting complex subunit 1 n=1 Tax=Lyophyllum shimeji TaxID=47721 RepID=A0A9P3PZ17_LYOSH|nr:putative anaphase promoting complex subunit 1 [Lyophyllum shimeji]